MNGIFHWAGTEEISRFELGHRILQKFGIDSKNIISGKIKDKFEKNCKRPPHLSFNLEPLASKVLTQPLSIEHQLSELKIPNELYTWYRENVTNPSCYIHRF